MMIEAVGLVVLGAITVALIACMAVGVVRDIKETVADEDDEDEDSLPDGDGFGFFS